MPARPTQARSEASRANGAHSAGPATPEGRSRSSRNATRHNLHGPCRLLPEEDAAALDALRADLASLHAPADAVEAHWVEEIAFAMWRQRRLHRLESAALDRAEEATATAGTDEPGRPLPLASLATLARYRTRVGRDLRLAEAELESARHRRRSAMRDAIVDAGDTGTTEPELAGLAEEILAEIGFGAGPAATPARQDEPCAAPAPHPLNRHQRRQMGALTRRIAA
jgi:hypothetical protein